MLDLGFSCHYFNENRKRTRCFRVYGGVIGARLFRWHQRDKNLGGNSLFRSEERIATEKRHLKRKWKAHIRLETYKSQDRVAMDAPRRQSVKL